MLHMSNRELLPLINICVPGDTMRDLEIEHAVVIGEREFLGVNRRGGS